MSFIPIIFLALIGWGIWRMMSATKLRTRRMKRKWTYQIFLTYVAVLLLATIVTGLLSKNGATESSISVSDTDSILLDNFYETKDFQSIDPALIIDKRTHPAGDMLQLIGDDFDMPSVVLIERKNDNDGVIEETILKPMLIVNGLDLSDQIQYNLPKWDGERVLFPTPPSTDLHFSSFQDSYLLHQFTKGSRAGLSTFSASSRQIGVHLLIPKDLQVKEDDKLYVEYIEH